MTDEEIKEYARGLILGACEAVNFPEAVPKVESENGEIGFEFDISSELVKGYIVYSPQPYIEFIIRTMQATPIISDGALGEFQRARAEAILMELTKLIMRMMLGELKGSATSLPFFVHMLIEKFYLNYNFFLKNRTQQMSEIDEIIDTLNIARKERIFDLAKEVYEETVAAPQFLFAELYDEYLIHWKQAKTLYTKNRKLSNVLNIVKDTFKFLSKDLVDKLALRGENEPSALAFESASRHLNTPVAESASKSTRNRYLSDSRKQREIVSDEIAQAAYDKYITYRREYLETIKELQKKFKEPFERVLFQGNSKF